MLRFYQLMRGLPDTKAANKELYELYNGDRSVRVEIAKHAEIIRNLPVESKVVSLEKRNATYQAMLDHCSLSKKHYFSLLQRGLSQADIQKNKYKSAPQVGLKSLGARLVAEGYDWKGVPGFSHDKKGKIQIMNLKPGILIPVRTREGLISGMQVRFDEPIDNRKYIWFSSTNEKMGTSVLNIEQIHFAGWTQNQTPKTIGITEGPLKADVTYALTGLPFIALIGVNNVEQLLPTLTELRKSGVENIQEYFDMDYFTNKHVEKAVNKIHDIIKSVGFQNVTRMSWNRQYKGIDDYVLARKKGITPLK